LQNIIIDVPFRGIALGDRIDWLCTANMMALRENDSHVLIHKEKEFVGWEEISSLFKPIKMILKLSSSLNNLNYINYYRYNISQENKKYQDLLSFHKDFPKIKVKDYSEYFQDLPEKFVTMQWDAGRPNLNSIRSNAEFGNRRCSTDEIIRIINFYNNLGYTVVGVGGQAENDILRNDLHKIAYIMSKAALHIGVDSGFMHLAKIVMPSNKIHIYTSNYMHTDTSIHLKNVLKAGAILNYSRDK
jgi:hypothetical protein